MLLGSQIVHVKLRLIHEHVIIRIHEHVIIRIHEHVIIRIHENVIIRIHEHVKTRVHMNEIEVHESIYYRFFFFYGIQIQTFYLISKTNIYKL